MTIEHQEMHYEGNVDSKGQAFGKGIATKVHDPDCTYEGTFKDNQPHGLVVVRNKRTGFKGIGEWRQG